MIHESFWTDPKIQGMSRDGKLFFLYLITNPYVHVSGLYRLPQAVPKLETGVGSEDGVLEELIRAGVIRWDAPRRVVWVVRMFRYQRSKGPKNLIAAANHLQLLHGSPLIQDFLMGYPEVKSFIGYPIDTLSMGYPEIEPQDQDQDQDQEREQEQKEEGAESPSAPVAANGDPWPSPAALVSEYNRTKPQECPECTKVTDGRKRNYLRALKQFHDRDFWLNVFRALHTSSFLRGLRPSPGHESFRATLDWLCAKGKDGTENAQKVAEGRYQDEQAPAQHRPGPKLDPNYQPSYVKRPYHVKEEAPVWTEEERKAVALATSKFLKSSEVQA